MRAITELEEGEAGYYQNDDDDEIDPEVDLTYIDEKVKNVLGHFRKDFEGLASVESLGAKFGEYGSFLPSYERLPGLWSQSKIHHKTHGTLRSPVEAASHRVTVAPNSKAEMVSSSVRPSNVPSEDVRNKDLYLPSTHAAEKWHSQIGAPVKLSNTDDPKTLKFRLKVGPDSMKRTNAAIYSGLGLEDSPSSSLGSSPKSNGDALMSHDTMDTSPTTILQVMTSFPISEGFLISPLHDSLLCLARKDENLKDSDSMKFMKGSLGHSPSSTKKPASSHRDRKIIKDEKMESKVKRDRVVEIRQADGISSEINLPPSKKNMETDSWDIKKPLSEDLKPTSLAKVLRDADSTKVVLRVSEPSRGTSKDDLRGRSVDMVKEDSAESIAGQESGKSKKRNLGTSIEKIGESKVVQSSMGDIMRVRDDENCKSNQSSASFKANSLVSQPFKDCGSADHPKQTVGKKLMFHEENDTKLASRAENPSNEGKKKQKGIAGDPKLAAIATAETTKVHNGVVLKNKKAFSCNGQTKNKMHSLKREKATIVLKNKKASSCDGQTKNKVHSVKREKATSKVQNTKHSNGGTTSKQMDCQMDMGRAFGQKTKISSHSKDESAKLNGRSTVRAIDDRLMSGGTVENALQRGLNGMESGLTSHVEGAATAPVLVKEDWVGCDLCHKWRLLPFGVKTEDLPNKWSCSMLNWLPGMNRCDISEEETTRTLRLLYQPSQSEDQNNLQMQRNGQALEATSNVVQSVDQNHENITSGDLCIPHKKYGSKGLPQTGYSVGHSQILDMPRNKLGNSEKSGSLGDMNLTLKEPKPMKKSTIKLVNKSHNLAGEEINISPEEKQSGSKKIKMKTKRKGDPNEPCVVKKVKTANVQLADAFRCTDMMPGRLGPSSGGGSQYKARERAISSEETKDIVKTRVLVSSKKREDQAQHSCSGSDIRNWRKGDLSSRKRKLKDLHIDEGHHVQDRDFFNTEESSENGSRNEKKVKTMKTERIHRNTNKDDSRPSEKQMVARVDRASLANGTEEMRACDKDYWPKNHQRKIGVKLTLEAVDELRRELGSDSGTTTSSTSKASSFLKQKNSYEERKSSHVESVSSSPLKTSKLDEHPYDERDIMGKEYCGLPATSKLEIVSESNGSGSSRKHGLSSGSLHVFALDNLVDTHLDNSGVNKVEEDGQCLKNVDSKDHCHGGDVMRKKHCHKAILQQNDFVDGEDSLLRSKNKDGNFKCDTEKDKMKVSDPVKRVAPKPRSGSQKERTTDGRALDASQAIMSGKQLQTVSKNVAHHNVEHILPHQYEVGELNALSRKDSSCQTVFGVLKEAKDLRHQADHLKCSGFGFESNETYFKAALKFLHGASLLETHNGEVGKHEMSDMQAYTIATKLCENCAHEFEKHQEMAATALAYKCVEVAYMRVVYCKNSSMSKDRQELQATLQMVTQGESPSSSASDVDNTNNPATVDKDNISNAAGSYASGNHVVTSWNRPNFLRLLDFTQDVISAMEASRKSQTALAAASLTLNEAQKGECITKVRKAIDFSFHDVEGLMHLIEHAWRAISCLGFSGSKD